MTFSGFKTILVIGGCLRNGFVQFHNMNQSRDMRLVLIVNASSGRSDEPAHTRSLVRAYAAHICKVQKWMKIQINYYTLILAVQACLKSDYTTPTKRSNAQHLVGY